MNIILLGTIAIIMFLLLLAIGVHISANFFLIGFLSIMTLLGIQPVISLLGQSMYHTIANPGFAALPLFILMGSFAARGGFAGRAYKCLYVLTSKLPGSLAVATSYGCALFGAICGSSLATAAVFGKVALPEMQKYKYDKSFSLGTIAASGTFACMIPPSYGLVLYAIFTGESIGKLFLAGIIPGLLTATVYSLSIIIRVKLNPKLAPKVVGESFSIKDKIKAIKDTWSIILLIIIVLGGIYSGFLTPNEAAAMGAFAALIIGIFQGELNNLDVVKECIRESARISSMIFIIITGALFFSRFIAITRFSDVLAYSMLGVRREFILWGICALWFFMGMIMEGGGIKALFLPIFFPIIILSGYNGIWFGIVTQKLGEIAAVTPPVGLNVFTLKGVAGEGTSLEEIFRGIWPFVLCDIIVLILIVVFPNIALYLPNLLLGK
ncbi:MAG: TRAP transporter large permease [Atribacterota bacterium]|nr:TRAP transporter large permease [Atribacterota bacterium]